MYIFRCISVCLCIFICWGNMTFWLFVHITVSICIFRLHLHLWDFQDMCVRFQVRSDEMVVAVLRLEAKSSPQREFNREEWKESIVRNFPIKQNTAGMKEEEFAGNYTFLLVFLCGAFFFLHNVSLKLSLGDKTETGRAQTQCPTVHWYLECCHL